MNRMASWLTGVSVVLCVAYLADWLRADRLAIAWPLMLLVLVPLWLAARLATARRRKTRRARSATPEPLLRFVWLGLVKGLALVMTLGLVFAVVDRLPLERQWLDADREVLEQLIRTLEEAGQWKAAAGELHKRLERPTSPGWRRVLARHHYDTLVRAASVPGESQAEALLAQACQRARSDKLNDTSAVATLKRLAAERQSAARAAKHAAELLSLRQSATTQADALAQAANDALRQTEQQAAERQQVFDVLLTTAAQVEDLDKRAEQLADASEWATRWGLDATRAQAALLAITEQRRSLAPMNLSAECRAEFRRVLTSLAPPVAIVDLVVKDRDGQSIGDLRAKDFRVTIGDQASAPVWSATSVVPTTQRPSVFVLLDVSGSMAGEALAAAKQGLGQFFQATDGEVEVALTTFNDRIVDRLSWTTETTQGAAVLRHVEATGGTLLYGGLQHGHDRIQARLAPRMLLVITDGGNSLPGPDPERLIGRFHAAGIPVHVVALETPKLDRSFLERLTRGTGGRLFHATSVNVLAQQILSAARSLRQPVYRLVFSCKSATPQISIRIGQSPGIVVETTAGKEVAQNP
ncbi:MAG: VWA domain-containing protein [Pirellulales bacterium]|nr:VWA domain-containing protein [Pirellulales bacterium]